MKQLSEASLTIHMRFQKPAYALPANVRKPEHRFWNSFQKNLHN
jgi:hypothetical protein